MIWTNKQKF